MSQFVKLGNRFVILRICLCVTAQDLGTIDAFVVKASSGSGQLKVKYAPLVFIWPTLGVKTKLLGNKMSPFTIESSAGIDTM